VQRIFKFGNIHNISLIPEHFDIWNSNTFLCQELRTVKVVQFFGGCMNLQVMEFESTGIWL